MRKSRIELPGVERSRVEGQIIPGSRRRLGIASLLLLVALTGCSAGGQYYVKPDLSPGGIEGVTGLTRATVPMAPLELGVTFKSAGKVLKPAGDTLYRMVQDDLATRGGWSVRRIGQPNQDFTPLLAAIPAATAGASAAADPAQAAAAPPRMIMLVEDIPDLSGGTRLDYFLSGMSVGLYGVRKAVDHYQVTIAYRDPNGVERVYHSQQELLYGHGWGNGQNDPPPPGAQRYGNVLAAFDRVVYDSISGTRHGTVTVGQPQMVPPDPPRASR